MAKKSKKASKESRPPAAESAAASAAGPKPTEVVSVGTEDERDEFLESLERPGLSLSEGGDRIAELLAAAESADVEGLEGPDRELLEAARKRAEESGSLEDAIRALEMSEAAAEAEATGADGSEADPMSFEELGVSADALTVTAKVDGEEVEIPLSEALQGYQRQEDYTRKTQELAEKRREAESVRERYAQQLEMLAVTIGRNLSPDQQRALAAEYSRVVGEINGNLHTNLAEAVEKGQAQLKETFGWEDEAEWDEARTNLRQYGHSLGFSDEELQAVHDPRLFEMLEKARRYDALKADAEEIRSGKRTRKPAATTLRPGHAVSTRSNPKERASREARKRFRQTGSVQDAAEIISGMLD